MIPNELTFHYFDECESTSQTVWQLLREQNISPPIAVQAKQQTHGRGQRGHQWQSPPGGLYLSILIQGTDLPLKRLSAGSLAFASCIAEYLTQTFDINISLKWPNDLMFGRKKLGGLLIESQVKSHVCEYICVGIGMNILATPRIDLNSTPYQPTSLQEILPYESFDVPKIAQDLTKYLLQRTINESWLNEYIEKYHNYLNPAYEYWHWDKHWWKGSIDHDSGCLQLTRSDHAKETLCFYESKPQLKPIAFDSYAFGELGNTHSKFYKIEDNKIISLNKLSQIKGFCPVAVVNQKQLDHLTMQYPEIDFYPIPRRPRRVRLAPETQMTIGIDRLAGMEAALSFTPTQYAMVMSAGTALTVDVINVETREHLGGLIAPGLQALWDVLATNTERLPLLKAEDVCAQEQSYQYAFHSLKLPLARVTEECMKLGCLRMFAGFLKQVQDDINIPRLTSHDSDKNMTYHVHGGSAKFLINGFQFLQYNPCFYPAGLISLSL